MTKTINNRSDWDCLSKFYRSDCFTRDELIYHYETRIFNKLQGMLEFDNLPDEIPKKYLTMYLQMKGLTGIVKVNGILYVVRDTDPASDLDAYYEAKNYLVVNPYIKGLKGNYIRGKDIAVIYHDSLRMGLYPIVHKYATMIADIHITIHNQTIMERMPYIISASSEDTKKVLDTVVKTIKQGDISIALDKAKLLSDNASIQATNFGAIPVGSIKELIELENYLVSSLEMELGLNSNYNMKREYVNSNENQIDTLTLVPSIDDILINIQNGLDECNKLFGTNITVRLGEAWRIMKDDATGENIEEEELDETAEKTEDENINRNE